MRSVVFFLVFNVLGSFAFAQEPPQFFSLDGRLYDTATPANPLADASVTMLVQVLNPAKSCVLYEEEQTLNTLVTDGYFNIRVGSPTAGPDSAKRSANDSGNSLRVAFQNKNQVINGKTAGGAACTYTPAAGDERHFRFIVTPATTGVTATLSPDMTIDSVPQAVIAETVQGLGPQDFIQVNANVTQAKADSLFGGSYAGLTSLLGGSSSLYLQNNPNGTVIPVRATDPAGPAEGQVWFDSASNVIKYYDGGAIQTLGTSGGDPTKLPLAGGIMAGHIIMGGNQILGTGHITMSPLSTITIGKYDNADQGTLTAAMNASNKGAMWFNSDTNKLMYWDGAAQQVVADMATAGGDITAVNSGAGLTGGFTAGAGTLAVDIGTAAGQLFTIDQVPNCPANQKLQMSLGPAYNWSCAADNDSGGDITAVNTNAGSGLSGGAATGAATLSVVVDGSTIEVNGTNQLQVKDSSITNIKIVDMAINKLTSAMGQYFTYQPNGAQCANNQVLKWDDGNDRWDCANDIDTNTDAVSTVFGRAGAVVSQNGDYTATQVTNTAAGNIAAVTVQNAINELDSEKVAKSGDTMSGDLNLGGNDLLALGNMTMNALSRINVGRFTNAEQATLVSGLAAGDDGAMWFNSETNKLMFWDGTAPQELSDAASAGGDVTAVNTNAPLTGGAVSGAITLSLAYDNSTIGINGSNQIEVKNGGIANAKLGADSVTTDKILDGTIDTGDIGNLKVTDVKIADVSVDKITSAATKYFTYQPNGSQCANNQVLKWDDGNDRWICANDVDTDTNTDAVTTVFGRAGVVASQNGDYTASQVTNVAAGNIAGVTLQAAVNELDTEKVNKADVPQCLAGEKLQMGAGPAYPWTCVSEAIGILLADADNDTKIQVEEAADEDKIRFDTGGTERMIIDNSGNVGIGTMVPATPLELGRNGVAGGLDTALRVSGARGSGTDTVHFASLELQNYDAGAGTSADFVGVELAGMVDGPDDAALLIRTATDKVLSTKMTIKANGNVGIGTGAPASMLEVAGVIHSTSGGIKFPDGTTQTTASGAGGIAGPSFFVHKGGTDQTVAVTTTTKLTWSTEVFDTNNNFAANRFTPTVAGKYFFSATAMCNSGNAVCSISIAKNGTTVLYNQATTTAAYVGSSTTSGVVDMNGTTDYVEAFIYSSYSQILGAAAYTNFSGSLLAPLASGSVTGTGTADYIPKWTNGTTVGSSSIFDNGTNVGIGTATPGEKLEVSGKVKATELCIGADCRAVWPAGGGGVAGTDTQIQYNNAGAMGASANFLWNDTSRIMSLRGTGGTGYINYDRGGGDAYRVGSVGHIFKIQSISFPIVNDLATFSATGITFPLVNMGIGTTTPTTGTRLDITGTGATASSIIIPRDTTGNRPVTGVNGMMRYNTTLNKFDVHENGNWYNLLTTADSGTAAGQFVSNDDVPNCAANEKLHMSVGPAYTWSCVKATALADADNDTKIQLEEAADEDKIRFDTGGSERMIIDQSGNVGIGATNPTNPLQIETASSGGYVSIKSSNAGTSAYTGFLARNDGAAGVLYMTLGSTGNTDVFMGASQASMAAITANSNTNGLQVGTLGASPLMFGTGNQERMRVTSGGNVGIGNNAPANLLSVGANGHQGQTSAPIQVRQNGNSFEWGHANQAGYGSTIGANVGNGVPFICLSCEAGTTANTYQTRGLKGSLIKTNNAGGIVFSTLAAATADNQTDDIRMTIDNTGNVGIGAAPTSKLDVRGVGVFGDSGYQTRVGGDSVSGSGVSWIESASGRDLTLWTGGSGERVRILHANGNMGVGVTPLFKLHVLGTGSYSNDGGSGGVAFVDAATPAKKLMMGYDPTVGTNGSAYIQSVYSGVTYQPLLLNTSGGNVGVGNAAPAAKLDVNGEVKVGNTALACSASTGGALRYNAGAMEYCNGTNNTWTAMGGGSVPTGTICGHRSIWAQSVTPNYDWNSSNVTCQGNTLTATLNGAGAVTATNNCPAGYTGRWNATGWDGNNIYSILYCVKN